MALATVSHNVVNASTPGYSRQIIQVSAASTGGYGAGVTLDNIQRVTDSFLSSRVLTATSAATYASTKSSYLTSLEDTFTSANANGGLENVVGGFITSLNKLAADPANSSLRRNAVQQATLTANALNGVNADLTAAANDADAGITAELDVVNSLLKDIYTLNTQIVTLNASGNGANSNDLLDARAAKVAQLSQDFGIQVTDNTSTGGVRILTESGARLVDENGYVQLSRNTPLPGSSYQSIVYQNVTLNGSLANTKMPINPADLTTGKIKALAEVRDTTIPALRAQVNEFTRVFTSTVNQLTSQGSSSPPMATLTSGNTGALGNIATDMLTNGFGAINGATINISVTSNLGEAITTTAGGTPITIAPTPPATTLSLQDIANIINNDPTIGNTALGGTQGVIATATTDADGKPILKITAADPNNKVVMANVTGDALGMLGMNNLFTGSTAETVAVRTDIASNPDLLPVARMNSTGGVSNTDGQNITALSGLSDTKINFNTAGGLGGQNTTLVGYLNVVSSTLAVNVSSAKDNETFTASLQSQAQEADTSVSGVNINEELAQMLVYQNSFQASARIISVVNDLLQELVNIMG